MNYPDDKNEIDRGDEFRNESSCAIVREHAAGYALGGLETAESDLIADHLLLCPECERAINRLTAIVPLLGLDGEIRSPSPELKTRLLANVLAEHRQAIAIDPAQEIRAAAPVPTSRSTWRRRPAIATAALLAIVVGLGAWGIYAQAELGNRSDEIAGLERSNEAMTVHLSSLQAGQLAFGANANSFQLTNVSATAADAGGVVVSGTGENTTVFSIWNMPDGHDSFHVICESKRGELLAAGEIVVNDLGNGTVTLTLPSPVTEYRAVHVLPTSSSATEAAELLAQDILKALLQEPELEE